VPSRIRMARRPAWRGIGLLRVLLLVIAAAAIAALAVIFGVARDYGYLRASSLNSWRMRNAVPEPSGPIPIDAPRKSAKLEKVRSRLPSSSSDSDSGSRPSTSTFASAGTGVPSCIRSRPNWWPRVSSILPPM